MENSNTGETSPSRSKTSDDLSKKILGSLQGKFTGEETAHWIADVNKEPAAAITKTQSEPVHLSSVAFLDKLFDDFRQTRERLCATDPLRQVRRISLAIRQSYSRARWSLSPGRS